MNTIFQKWFKQKGPKTFGTFQGVFTPTMLTILGVIMFIRHPWVVGNAGVVGAFAIVMISLGITLCTSLSMSSMTTNIRIGSGGPFSIIAQSLGLEIGGSIGIPLYLSQACAVAMYIFGFREGWLTIFPLHNHLLVDFSTFAVIVGIALISTDFAFKIQYIIMALIIGSIASIVLGLSGSALNLNEITWIGSFLGEPIFDHSGNLLEFKPGSFWIVFAVFFPAVTGIMAGANMSGELTDPQKSIPRGTLSAVIASGLIYLGLIFVAALLASPSELVSNYSVFIDKSAWKPIVIAGLLGATFSSALTSLVGAPRILGALGEKQILPSFFAKKNKSGEPINAILLTSLVIVFSLLLRDLNTIAPLITMIFLIAYAMINIVVLIEQSLGLPSFRPIFKIPLIIPILGTVGCIFVMFIINPIVSLIALSIVIAFYSFLIQKEFEKQKGDTRSGLFKALAEWATKKSNELSPEKQPRAWQPELLIPVESPKDVRGAFRLIYALTHPRGSVKMLGMHNPHELKHLQTQLPQLAKTFNKAHISASYSIVHGKEFARMVRISMQALDTAFFKPNTIFLKLKKEVDMNEKYLPIVKEGFSYDWAFLMFAPYEQVGLGIENVVNIWIDVIPDDWETNLNLGHNDLTILVGLIIAKNWNAKLNLIKTIRKGIDASKEEIEAILVRIRKLARIPKSAGVYVIERNPDMWFKIPPADLNIMEIPQKELLDFEKLMDIPDKLRTSCLFTSDSSLENALV
jgi:amino acid transporter